VERGTQGCGNKPVSILFFFSYLILITLVFLNLFIAIILNGYFETCDQEASNLNKDLLGQFADAWSRLDPDATGFIKIVDFQNLMFELGPPLGWGQDHHDKPERTKRHSKMASRQLQTYLNQTSFFFNDVLDIVVMLYIIRD
jgi:hypothetical protein